VNDSGQEGKPLSGSEPTVLDAVASRIRGLVKWRFWRILVVNILLASPCIGYAVAQAGTRACISWSLLSHAAIAVDLAADLVVIPILIASPRHLLLPFLGIEGPAFTAAQVLALLGATAIATANFIPQPIQTQVRQGTRSGPLT
jgi:hypothetical protein